MFDIHKIVRKNIRQLKPYSSARDEFKGKAGIWFDANENPFESKVNRYPDPYQKALKKAIGTFKNIAVDHIFLSNGSDEAIDLLFRVFCEPRIDKLLLFTPTYGMYEVTANINDIDVIHIPLNKDFQINMSQTLSAINDRHLKLIFICSPNNPSGNVINKKDILDITKKYNGLVVVDEAYIDFTEEKSMLQETENYPNLVVLQTFSKAWGMAAARLGMAFAHPNIVQYLTKIKSPYNVNQYTQEKAFEALEGVDMIKKNIKKIINEKVKLIGALERMETVVNVFPSDANFLLVKFTEAKNIYNYLLQKGLVVRDRTNVVENCLRITVGTARQNEELIKKLKQYKS